MEVATAADQLPAPLAGGRYTFIRKLGQGNFGAVYLVYDNTLGMLVALKELHWLKARSKELRERFLGEGRTAMRITHRNVVRVYDANIDGERVYLTMEYIDGETLLQRLDRGMTIRQTVAVLSVLLTALAAVHEAGVVHRDVKPENIMIAKGKQPGDPERIVLMDLGIAADHEEEMSGTKTGIAMGSPAYMPPEQFADFKRVDSRGDLYAVGAVAYHLLSDTLPHMAFADTAEAEGMQKLPPAFLLFILKALSRAPKDRYQKAEEMQTALAACLAATPDPDVQCLAPEEPEDQVVAPPVWEVPPEQNQAPEPEVPAEEHVDLYVADEMEATEDVAVPSVLDDEPYEPPKTRNRMAHLMGVIVGLMCLLGGIGWFAWPTADTTAIAAEETVMAQVVTPVPEPEPKLAVPEALKVEEAIVAPKAPEVVAMVTTPPPIATPVVTAKVTEPKVKSVRKVAQPEQPVVVTPTIKQSVEGSRASGSLTFKAELVPAPEAGRNITFVLFYKVGEGTYQRTSMPRKLDRTGKVVNEYSPTTDDLEAMRKGEAVYVVKAMENGEVLALSTPQNNPHKVP